MSTGVAHGAMPDVVVVHVPKEERLPETCAPRAPCAPCAPPPPPPPPFTVLARFRRVLGLPLRLAKRLLLRLLRRLFGPRPRP